MPKTVVLGVTGSIAAYKSAEIVSRLKKRGVDVRCILTRSGAEFITPVTLETLAKTPVVTDMFSRKNPYEVEHISLARAASVFAVAPASANFLGKAANGIADDMLSSTVLATRAPLIIAPAMNDAMLSHPAVQENIKKLKERGAIFVEPDEGMLACGTSGKGRLCEPENIVEVIMHYLERSDELAGKRVLVSAGATVEALDPVRFLTNRSTGKMGFAIAKAAFDMGAAVTLIAGRCDMKTPYGVRRIDVRSTADMQRAVETELENNDVFISAAAPCDFTPASYSETKLKKNGSEMSLLLKPTSDILASVSARAKDKLLIGFAAETNNIENNAMSKLEKKGLYAICANDVTDEGCGFAVDTNAVTMYFADGRREKSPLMQKTELGRWILTKALCK